MRRGSMLKVAAVGVVGLVAVGAFGAFGYRAATGNCILGLCHAKADKAAAAVTPVAATSTVESEHCQMACSESKTAVETVAHEHAGATECAGKMADCAGTSCNPADCDPANCDKADCPAKLAATTPAADTAPAAPETAPVGG